jgi:UDP-3-O-[3-hydroxymyristoyl] glucosamine N-acyltransferase
MASLLELARLVNGQVIGDGATEITGVAGVEDAKAGNITFIATMRGIEIAIHSEAAAVIIPQGFGNITKPAIMVANPRLAFAQLLAYFHPRQPVVPALHPAAVIGERFRGAECLVSALVYIGDDVTIGKGSMIYPGAVIMDRVTIGDGCTIHANVVIREDCSIGNRVEIHAGSVVGADGFGYVTVDGKHVKVPQVGTVIIEDDVEMGANVTIDRATTGVTLIKRGTKIDNLVQIAHNCRLGEDNFIIGQVGIASNTKLGDRVTMAGKSSIVGHAKVGENSVIAAHALVINNLAPNSFVSGVPARPHAEDMRIQAAAGRLPELLKEFRELQKRVAELEGKVLS